MLTARGLKVIKTMLIKTLDTAPSFRAAPIRRRQAFTLQSSDARRVPSDTQQSIVAV